MLIVGAGPTGLTLAIDLARRGVPCRVVDRSPTPFTGSRGKGLQPRTQEVFEDLGVLDRIRAAGGPYPPMRAYRGAEIVWEGRLEEPREPAPGEPYPNAWMVPQFRTTEILRDRLAELGGSVETGTELVGLGQDDAGVTATVARAGRTGSIRAGYLVGADGGGSTVRRAAGMAFLGETVETQRMLVADVRATGVDRAHWHVWPEPDDPGRAVALCPLAGTDLFQFTAMVAPDSTPETTAPAVREILDAATGRAGIRLVDVGWTSLWRSNIRMVDRYRVGRVFLAGDAAHVHPPTGGQGLNTGVQDAYNLGWKLALVLAGAPDGLLDSYQAERLPVAADVLGISATLYDAAVRGAADAHRRDDPRLKQLGVTYRDGPLAAEHRPAAPGPRAGDRAPDAPCRDADGHPVRLFDLFRGPHVSLLTFTGDDRLSVRAGGRRVDLVDTGGHARDAYGVPAGVTYVLVRPDGHVGVASHDRADVDRYLDRLGATLPTP
ncbi:FAD-dependent monooxygenase [Micromonospora zhanjiangensis]